MILMPEQTPNQKKHQNIELAKQIQAEFQKYKDAEAAAFQRLQVAVYNALKCLPPQQDTVDSSVQFIQKLTQNEKIAFVAIANELEHGRGNISVVKIQQKTNLSRPVFTSLFNKMKEYCVATIENQGVKGTHIVLHNLSLPQQVKDTMEE